MAPMTTWASNDDYTISDDEVRHYKARVSGVGLVITGCTRVTPSGIGFPHEYAAYDDSFIPSLKKLAVAAKKDGARAILQIYHAGNKANPGLIPNADQVSASAVATGPQLFVNGFLLQKFPLEVVREVQRVISEHAKSPFLLGYRISPEEPQPEGYKMEDIYPLLDKLIESKVDYIHASLFNVLESKPIGATEGKTIAELILNYVAHRIPVIAAGQVRTPEDAAKAIDMGLALAAIGHALIINPTWVERAATGEKVDESLSISKLPELAIPQKLWTVIDVTKGWFQLTA